MADSGDALSARGQGEPSALARRIDHTIVAADTGPDDVDRACAEAYEHGFGAVCVPPMHLARASRWLKRTRVQLSTVVDFPYGYSSSLTKLFAVQEAAAKGATEVGVVIAAGVVSGGDWVTVKQEMEAIAKRVGTHVHVKAIVDAGAISSDTLKRMTTLVTDTGASRLQVATGLAGGGTLTGEIRALGVVARSGVALTAASEIDSWEKARQVLMAGAERLSTDAGVRILEGWQEAGCPAIVPGSDL